MDMMFLLDRYFMPLDGKVIATSALYKGEYEPFLVILSIIIAAVCAYIALAAADRSAGGIRPMFRLLWLGLAGVTMGGGIWTMHFIGMLSFSLPCAIAYEPVLTLASMVPGIVASGVALWVIRSSTLRAGWTLALGGVLMAGGIAAMHYSGMAAMQMGAILYYDPARVGLSVVVAVTLAWLSLGLPQLLGRWTSRTALAQPLAALGLGLAVSGMHYTAMSAALFAPIPGELDQVQGLEPGVLAALITIIVTLLAIAVMAVVFAAKQSTLAAEMRNEVAQRRQAERQAEEQRSRVQAIFDNVVDGIITTDATGAIQHWSPAAERLFGYAFEEVRGRNVAMLMPDASDRDGNIDPARVQKGEKVLVVGSGREVIGRRKDGTTFPLDLAVGRGEVEGTAFFTGVMRDLTERKRELAVLEDARDRAEAATRAKSEFLANMSHEIRTPMNAVLGFLGLVLERSNLDEQLRRFLNTAHNSATNLLVIIDDILDFSKLESGKVTLEDIPFDLRRLVADAIGSVTLPAREKALDLSWQVDDNVFRQVHGDPTRVRQVLLNLLSNAVKFTDRGTVRVVVSRPDPEAELIAFAVSDTGPGMTPETLERILLPFEQADASTQRRYGGTGLGTTISRKLAEVLGGTFWAESAPGVGSTFHFTSVLPDVAGAALAAPMPADAHAAALRINRGFKVLLAEDVHDNVLLVREMLESRGHEVVVAGDGAQAVQQARTEAFDLVLMDIQMPVIDGVEATEQIRAIEREQGGHVPIIALTASVTESERARCLAAGMDAVVAKPVNFATLFTEMEAVVAKGGGRNLEAFGQTNLAWLRPIADIDAVASDWPDAERYLRYLKSVVAETPGILDSLADHIALNEIGEAEEISHTLGAVAANLGLGDLAAAANHLEQLLERGDPGSVKAILPLRKAVAGLAALLAEEGAQQEAAGESHGANGKRPPVDNELLRRLFGDLHLALDTDNPDPAETLVARLADFVDHDRLAPLRQAIETFDFPQARRQAERISVELGFG